MASNDEPKVAGSSIAEQLEDEDNKGEINCNMTSNDEYHLLEEIDLLAWHYDSENEDHVKLLEDFMCQTKKVKTYQTRVFRCPFTPSDIEVEQA